MNNTNNSTNTNDVGMFSKIKKYFHDLFYENDSYDFTLPNTTNSIVTDDSSAYNTSNRILNLENETLDVLSTKNDKVFPSIDVNLDYMKVRYNSMINSDVIIREFILNARGKQYKAFLVYVDGMTDQEIMNNYILKPLMLRNSTNIFDGDQNRVISEVKTNNITVRKIKKFASSKYCFKV